MRAAGGFSSRVIPQQKISSPSVIFYVLQCYYRDQKMSENAKFLIGSFVENKKRGDVSSSLRCDDDTTDDPAFSCSLSRKMKLLHSKNM